MAPEIDHAGRRGLRIGSIVIDCIDHRRMIEFWSAALGYAPREPATGDFVILRDPAGKGPNVSLQDEPGRLTGRNWLHFDLYTDDRTREVGRLLALGAKEHAQEYDTEDDFRVLEDPDGNLFCVVQIPAPPSPR